MIRLSGDVVSEHCWHCEKVYQYNVENPSGSCDTCRDLRNRIFEHKLKNDEIHKDLIITITYKVYQDNHSCKDVDKDEHTEIHEFQVLKGFFKNEDLTPGKRVKIVHSKKMHFYMKRTGDCSYGYRCQGGKTYEILDAKISKIEADFFDE